MTLAFTVQPRSKGRLMLTARTVRTEVLFPLETIETAAQEWYGSTDIDSCCLAEGRLRKGEKP